MTSSVAASTYNYFCSLVSRSRSFLPCSSDALLQHLVMPFQLRRALCAGLKDLPQAQKYDPSFEPLNGRVFPVSLWAEQRHCSTVKMSRTRPEKLNDRRRARLQPVSESGRPSHWNSRTARVKFPGHTFSGYASRRAVLFAVKVEYLLCDYKRHNHPSAAALRARVCDAFALEC
jgi:hypothetical protein